MKYKFTVDSRLTGKAIIWYADSREKVRDGIVEIEMDGIEYELTRGLLNSFERKQELLRRFFSKAALKETGKKSCGPKSLPR